MWSKKKKYDVTGLGFWKIGKKTVKTTEKQNRSPGLKFILPTICKLNQSDSRTKN